MRKISIIIMLVTVAVVMCSCQSGHNVSSSSQNSSSANSNSSSISIDEPNRLDLTSLSEPEINETTVECPEYERSEDFGVAQQNAYGSERDYPIASVDDEPFNPENLYWMPAIDNETELETLLKYQAVNSELAWIMHGDVGYAWPFNLSSLGQSPLLYFRQMNAYDYYTVYRVGGGGRMYVFLSTGGAVQPVGNAVPISYMTLYLQDRMESGDFQHLQVGDSIDRVIEIDRSVQMEKNKFHYPVNPNYPNSGPMSISLLADGIMVFRYELKGDEIVISSMEYCEDFILRGGIDSWQQDLSFKILPQDYPPET